MAVGSDAEGALGEIQAVGVGLDQACAPAHGLGLEAIHQIGPQDAVGEAGEVLHVGGGHQLTAGNAPVLKARDHDRAEVGAGGVDGSGVPGRAGANDHQVLNDGALTSHG